MKISKLKEDYLNKEMERLSFKIEPQENSKKVKVILGIMCGLLISLPFICSLFMQRFGGTMLIMGLVYCFMASQFILPEFIIPFIDKRINKNRLKELEGLNYSELNKMVYGRCYCT